MSRGTHHHQTLQGTQRGFLSASPQPRNCVVLIRHLTSCRSVSFVEKKCEISKDTKHPDRWRPAYICRSTVSEHDRTPYNQYVLQMCSEREDGWAEEVRSRVLCSLSDLHASDARYHKDCLSRFFSNRMNPAGQGDATQALYHEYQPDMALKHYGNYTV